MKLSRTNEIKVGDLFVIWKGCDSDFRGVPLTDVLTFLNANLTFPTVGAFTTQYSAPSSSGFSIPITDNGLDVHLILTPTAGFASGTLVLPPVANVVDKQEILVNCTQQITTLTINGNGASAVTGEPGSMGADDFFRLKFDSLTSTWYRVG